MSAYTLLTDFIAAEAVIRCMYCGRRVKRKNIDRHAARRHGQKKSGARS